MTAVAGGAQTAEQLSCTLQLSGFLLFSMTNSVNFQGMRSHANEKLFYQRHIKQKNTP